MLNIGKRQAAVSLVEVLIAMAILSTLALPMGMFLLEYNRGSSQLGDYYQILNTLEEKLETVLAMNYDDIPPGEKADVLVENEGRPLLDLRPAQIANNRVYFRLRAETVAVDFTAMKDSTSGQLQKVRVDNGMKKVEIFANWGDKKQHSLSLLAYRADL
jgi:prepilin-type N-terminal cleavage/methylation domain-containing protein